MLELSGIGNEFNCGIVHVFFILSWMWNRLLQRKKAFTFHIWWCDLFDEWCKKSDLPHKDRLAKQRKQLWRVQKILLQIWIVGERPVSALRKSFVYCVTTLCCMTCVYNFYVKWRGKYRINFSRVFSFPFINSYTIDNLIGLSCHLCIIVLEMKFYCPRIITPNCITLKLYLITCIPR